MMRIHAFQHVPFEDLAFIEVWGLEKGASITKTRWFEEAAVPSFEEVDLLVVLGGPMSVHDSAQYPWLRKEKEYVEQALKRRLPVLGICLGAQLLAEQLGSKVKKAPEAEIGWYPLYPEQGMQNSEFCGHWSSRLMAFHWHGETFDLPSGGRALAKSEPGYLQAFEYENHVLALQCHLESTSESIEKLLSHCASDLVGGPWVQSSETIRRHASHIPSANACMADILDTFAASLGLQSSSNPLQNPRP